MSRPGRTLRHASIAGPAFQVFMIEDCSARNDACDAMRRSTEERMRGRRAMVFLCGAMLAMACSRPGLTQPPPGPPPGMPPSPPFGPTSLEPNTNRPGGDFSNFALPQPYVELCRSACDRDRQCVAYT